MDDKSVLVCFFDPCFFLYFIVSFLFYSLMFDQIFLSPHVKGNMIISDKHGIFELLL